MREFPAQAIGDRRMNGAFIATNLTLSQLIPRACNFFFKASSSVGSNWIWPAVSSPPTNRICLGGPPSAVKAASNVIGFCFTALFFFAGLFFAAGTVNSSTWRAPSNGRYVTYPLAHHLLTLSVNVIYEPYDNEQKMSIGEQRLPVRL
jgi:hypothetical protein